MNTIQKNAMREIERIKVRYMRERKIDERTAYYQVQKEQPELFRRYQYGDDSSVRAYADSLPPARQWMVKLQGDAEAARRLADNVIAKLAQLRVTNVGPGIADAREALKQATIAVQKAYPALARCAVDGYLADDDFATLAQLIPSIAGAIQKGEYHHRGSVRRYVDDGNGNEYRRY